MKKFPIVSLLALGLTSGLFADTITFTSLNGGAAIGSPKLNFNNLAFGNATQSVDAILSVSFTGTGGVVQGAASGLYAAPFVSGSNGLGFDSPDQLNGVDATKYLTTGIGTVTLQFSSAQTYLGLLWGSVDNYNTLQFYSGNTLLGSFTGVDVWASANGDQGQQGTFYVNFNDTNGSFDRVVAISTSYAFEFDNVAYSDNRHVPDGGATVAMVGVAFAGLAAFRRQR